VHRHHSLHFLDKSSIVAMESRNETYLLKIQRSWTVCSLLPGKRITNFVYLYQWHVFTYWFD